jgi:hypothetical protein
MYIDDTRVKALANELAEDRSVAIADYVIWVDP